MTNNTALQVTNFNFYGDDLIALKDNATGEIYTSINSVLRGIGFTERQIRHNREKWLNDTVISRGCQNYVTPDNNGINQDTYCISVRKLPIALTKVSITPKMKANQPDLALKLELYQDKCADVLASVFIDHKTTDQITVQPILDTLNTFTKTVNDTLLSLNEKITKLEESQEHIKKRLPKKRFSYWTSKMFPKYQLLMDYLNISSNNDLYKELYKEFCNLYPDIELNQIIDDFCNDNNLQTCFTLDAIEHNKDVRKLFEDMVNSLLDKYGLMQESTYIHQKTIFDD